MTRREQVERHEAVEIACALLGWLIVWIVVIQEIRCGFCHF